MSVWWAPIVPSERGSAADPHEDRLFAYVYLCEEDGIATERYVLVGVVEIATKLVSW